jgi:hypothetical protein
MKQAAEASGQSKTFSRKVEDSPLIDEVLDREPFRRADLVDLFAVPGVGVPFALRREAQSSYPKCGFRGFVCRTLLLGALKQPWRPLPMLRW